MRFWTASATWRSAGEWRASSASCRRPAALATSFAASRDRTPRRRGRGRAPRAPARGPATVVPIPSTPSDVWWKTIHSPRNDPAWIRRLADEILTENGRAGQVRRVLDAGGWPIWVTHWQSLFSNGLETGLAVLDE